MKRAKLVLGSRQVDALITACAVFEAMPVGGDIIEENAWMQSVVAEIHQRLLRDQEKAEAS